MSGVAFPIDADQTVTPPAPAFPAAYVRTAMSGLFAPTTGRPLGARSGVFPGREPTITASATQWRVTGFPCVIDPASSQTVGPYMVAFQADEIGSMTGANSNNPRIDLLYVVVPEDPTKTDRVANIVYLPGTASATPQAPTIPASAPAGSLPLATIYVPKATTGNPTVTPIRQRTAAAGGCTQVANLAELNGLTKWQGRLAIVEDSNSFQQCSGSNWMPVGAGFLYGEASGTAVEKHSAGYGMAGDGRVTVTLPVGRRVRIYVQGLCNANSATATFGAIPGYIQGTAVPGFGSNGQTNPPSYTAGIRGQACLTVSGGPGQESVNAEGSAFLSAGTYTFYGLFTKITGGDNSTEGVLNNYVAVYDAGAY